MAEVGEQAEAPATEEQETALATEEQVASLVRDFYAAADADPLLGPMFRAVIPDWQGHLAVVTDFWSRVLLGTDRYAGCVMSAHGKLRMSEAQFDRWLTLFRQAAEANLPPAGQKRVMEAAGFVDQRLRHWQAAIRERESAPRPGEG